MVATTAPVATDAGSRPVGEEESAAVPAPAAARSAKLNAFEDQVRADLIAAGLADDEASDCVVAWRMLPWTRIGGGRAFAGMLGELGSLIKAGHVRVARIKKDRPQGAKAMTGDTLYIDRREYVNSVQRAGEDIEFTVIDVPATKVFWDNVKVSPRR